MHAVEPGGTAGTGQGRPADAIARVLADRLCHHRGAARGPFHLRTTGLTRQAIADQIGVHITQLRRQPALNSPPSTCPKARGVAFSISTDALDFNPDERSPKTPDCGSTSKPSTKHRQAIERDALVIMTRLKPITAQVSQPALYPHGQCHRPASLIILMLR